MTVDDGKVFGVDQTGNLEMSKGLKILVERFTPLQKRYAEFRAKGLTQAEAALKAGSKAGNRQALGRVGYGWEQEQGMKEYIAYLYEKRARMSVLDEIELIEKLRANYELAMESGRVDWANKSLEIMGLMIGAFDKNKKPSAKDIKDPQNSVESNLKEELVQEGTHEDKLKAINSLLRTLPMK